MIRISEIIVVEGQNDTNRLQQFFDVDTIETGGFNLSPEVIERVRAAQQRRGVIVFTDPDPIGERIRTVINKKVPGVKNAFISQKVARDERRHKVGVEHADYEDLHESLKNCVTFREFDEPSLSWSDFIDLGLVGNKARREKLSQAFHIGHCSAKVCYKRLCQLGISKEEIEEALA